MIRVILAILFCVLGLTTGYLLPHTAAVAPTTPDIYQLWQLTNQVRQTAGIAPLSLDMQLDAVAKARCADMVARNYYSHITPDGTTPQQTMHTANPAWKYTGENIAAGYYPDAKTVHDAWMASAGHKRNILDPKVDSIGIATCHSDNQAVFYSGTLVIEDFAS